MSLPNSLLLKVDVHGRRTDRWLARLALVAPPIGVLIAFFAAGPGPALAWYVLCSFLAAALCALGVWCEGVLGGRRRLLSIALQADGCWLLTDARGTGRMRLRAGSRAGRGWLWLRWTPDAGTVYPGARSLLLTGADLPADELRRLQLYLRWHGSFEHPLRNRRGVLAAPGGA